MLKRIVENDDIDTLCNRLPDSTRAIRRFNHRDARIQAFVHQSLISAVAAQNDSGFRTLLGQAARYPCGHRGLPRTAD